jgi:hypothetical protein
MAEYEAPKLEVMGSLTELTLDEGSGGMTQITPP